MDKLLYSEQVRDVALETYEATMRAMKEVGITLDSEIGDELYELIYNWIDDNYGRGLYQHQMG